MKHTLKAIAGIAALSSFAAFAQQSSSSLAGDNGFYVGGNYGYLKVDGDNDFDDDNDVWQGLVGYRFNDYIAIEGGIVDFGSYGNEFGKASTDGYTAAVKGTLPLNDMFSVYAKAGQLWSETEYRADAIGFDDDDESLFIGAGVSYAVTKQFLVNAEYTIYDASVSAGEAVQDFDDTDLETDFHQASLGVEYRF